MGLKGIMPILSILTITSIVLTGIIIAALFYSSSDTNVSDVLTEVDSTAVIKGQELAKTYLKSILDRSYNQAMYDNSLNGGFNYEKNVINPIQPLECDLSKCSGIDEHLGKEVLKKGDIGLDVGKLQCVLSNLKFEGNPYHTGSIDCIFGKETEASVTLYQEKNEMNVNGYATIDMLKIIESDFNQNWDNCRDFFSGCYGEIFWTDNSPDMKEIESGLRVSIINKLNEYDMSYKQKLIKIPDFDLSNIEITDNGNEIVINTETESISYDKVEEQPLGKVKIVFEMSSDIEIEYPRKYYDLYDKSREIYQRVKQEYKCADLGEDADNLIDDVVEDDYLIFVAFQEKTDNCKIFVSVTDTSEEYLVSNVLGEASLEDITFEYYMLLD